MSNLHILRYTKSIITFLGVIMLLACKNDLQTVYELTNVVELPEMSGENLTLIYSDSARINYKMLAPEYIKYTRIDQPYDEFPAGIHIISYDTTGNVSGEITSKYAKKVESENVWEARDEVVVINSDGTKLETELLYWDMTTKRIYSDRYCRLTMKGNIIEGNNGFESDQDLKRPSFTNVTGEIEYSSEE